MPLPPEILDVSQIVCIGPTVKLDKANTDMLIDKVLTLANGWPKHYPLPVVKMGSMYVTYMERAALAAIQAIMFATGKSSFPVYVRVYDSVSML